MLIALAGALTIGLSLGLLGSGGSILTVPVLHYLLGQPEQAAIGGSLLVVGSIAAVAAVPYARAGQVAWQDVLWFGLPGMAGAWAGASLARWIPGDVQLAGFAFAMLIAALRMLAPQALDERRTAIARPRSTILAGGAGVGLLSGIVGVGGGFLIVPALVLLAKVPLSRAVGTSLAIITLNSLAGFASYVSVLAAKDVQLDWRTLAIVTGVGITGSLLGHQLGKRLPQPLLRRIFSVTLMLLAAVMTVDLARRWLA